MINLLFSKFDKFCILNRYLFSCRARMRQKVSKYTWLRKCRSISCIVRIRSLLHKVQITLPCFHHFPSAHVHFRCRLANKLAAKSCLTWLMEYLTYSYVITEPSSFNHVLHHSRRHSTCQWWSCWKFVRGLN